MDLDLMNYIFIALCSGLFFLFVTTIISPTISPLIAPAYKQIAFDKQIDWDTRISSTFHAIIAVTVAIYIMAYEESIHTDPLWANSRLSYGICSFTIGYMISDLFVILYRYKEIGLISYIIHHLTTIYAYLFVVLYRCLPWIAIIRLCAEFSTPWVNMRFHLECVGDKSSKRYLVNGIMMMFTFFTSRILILPYFWLKIYSLHGSEEFIRLGRIAYALYAASLSLDGMNLVWTYKLYKGAKKTIKRFSQDKNENEVKTK